MKYRQLLAQSKICLDKNPVYVDAPVNIHIFSSGAKWMADQLNTTATKPFDNTINFGLYGTLKYGVCILAFIAAVFLLWHINIFLLPLAVLVFYFFEVHFLFLFPLLLDNIQQPLLKSISLSYTVGIIRCMTIVIPISIFMLAGLLNIKSPFKNWHTGSLAILIWYKNDIRNRL
ncbi:hypothetical protein [Ferruginibacter sp. SUN106]|uniref:hypothetical protein n=1 Tax=Ferruginibacter sp. SUN106 TaxID=2978348 RepID=UPI003D3664DD